MKIILIGFMGAGKTTVAKIIAKKLKLEMIDMDSIVLGKSGRKSINEIFEKDGEAKFRKIEQEVAKDVSKKDDVIISTGGGVVMNPLIMDYLRANGTTVYLSSSFDKIKKRVSLKKVRPPLFQNIKSAKKLFDLRSPLYERYANLNIETDNKDIYDVAKEIIGRLK